ncbi:MAG TPA: ABC transporter substrate-binding protein [Chloroflexota bacterium]|nr:ABC transporter substrate-binding protein [Chloroflexota bacterium]
MTGLRGVALLVPWVAAAWLLTACAPAAPAAAPAGPVPPAAGPAPASGGAAPSAAPTAATAADPPAAEPVRFGVLSAATDAGIFIAQELGYFREQGVDLDLVPFDSAARMVAPLGAGQLDAGGGSHSAGLFNAVARGIDLKLVADKGVSSPGHGFQALVFRKDLADSGRLRSTADLRGLRVALPARGITAEASLERWLRAGGLGTDDVELTELNFAEHGAALSGQSVEAAISIEPFLTFIVERGIGVVHQRSDEFTPGYQLAEIIYSGQFARDRAEAGRRFMIAYLKGVRYYDDAFDGGDAAKRQEAVAILTRSTAVKDPALYDRMVMPGLDPNGRLNVASIAEDQDLWLASGLQQARVNLDEVVDPSFTDAAVAALGPYR